MPQAGRPPHLVAGTEVALTPPSAAGGALLSLLLLWGMFEGGRDFVQDARGFVQHFFIAEAEHAVAVGAEVLLALPVVGLLVGMLVDLSVHFDDQAGFMAEKVGDERPDGVLAAEFESAQLAVAQVFPEVLFGGGCSLAQFARALDQGMGRATLTPPPGPFPGSRGRALPPPPGPLPSPASRERGGGRGEG